jgi:hypothetical protein
MRWFVSLKAYGDCIIASHALRSYGSLGDILLCGSHLRPLMKAVGYQGNVEWLETGDAGVPAFFDLRKFGLLSAISSGLTLRRLINCRVAVNDQLVFDRVGWRQNFLAGGTPTAQVASGQPNIYLDYERFLSGRVNYQAESPIQKTSRIGIFPDSRLATKQLSDALVSRIFRDLIGLGCDPQVVYIDGKPMDAGMKVRIVNGFGALIECIREFDLIISADSLPAHVAQYFERPVFVFSPVNNHYWLPKSAFLNGRFALFGEIQKCRDWVLSLQKKI